MTSREPVSKCLSCDHAQVVKIGPPYEFKCESCGWEGVRNYSTKDDS